MDQGMDNDLILDAFVFETVQLIDQLEQIMIENEKTGKYDEDSINEIFRIIHTIKGSSSMMFFTGISELAHSVENLFAFLRENKFIEPDYSKITDMVLKALDFIKEQVALIQEGKDSQGSAPGLIESMERYLAVLRESCESRNIFKVEVFFQKDCMMENVRAFGILHKLMKIAGNIRHIPRDIAENEGSADIIRENGFKLIFKTGASLEEVRDFLSDTLFIEHLNVSKAGRNDIEMFMEAEAGGEGDKDAEIVDEGIKEAEIGDEGINEAEIKAEIKDEGIEKGEIEGEGIEEERVGKSFNGKIFGKSTREEGIDKGFKEEIAPEGGCEKAGSKTRDNKDAKSGVISVSLAKLDRLLDFVGELVITESMVTRNPDIAGLHLENFNKSARQLRKIINEIQDIAMSIRMVPISMIFMKMNRILRDMSKKLGKEAELEITGEETEVDKNIIEHLSDPIMHLIRNSLDHGIESSAERLKAGKAPKGRIILEARSEGGDVWITVRDDGRGLDREKILKKAREYGLIDKNESEYTDMEVYSMIFLPGFSTKDSVSEFSGRGVGMDVVVKNIEKIGGAVQVESKIGEGTAVHIKIPLTLAIINGMIVRVGKLKYIIPTTAIKESFRITEGDVVKNPEGEEMIMVRGKCYVMKRLHDIFSNGAITTGIQKGVIVMVENNESNMCLFVDEIIEEQQVVVKALPVYIRRMWGDRCMGIGGCTLLGDGSISLILNVAGIMSGR